MFNVISSQFNYLYGDQIHFPYSIGRLVTYVKSNEELSPNFDFKPTYIFRDKLEEYVERSSGADILLCSCYVWNWEITIELAKKIKKINPDCLIIFGGPQVPSRTANFFDNHPYVDLLVHGEGELILEKVLLEYLNNKDFSKIDGVESKEFKTKPNTRTKDLNKLPSPYLSNVIWDLVEKRENINFAASWETNRGCPYPCTFCDWGSLTNSGLTKWSDDQLFKEIEWFSKNKIGYIDCCDANFGIFQERDLRIAEKLREVSLENGYPERFRVAWAKFSSEKIIPIAKKLQDGNVLKAVSLALQSLDETALDTVKRANIKFSKFSQLTDTFRKNGIPTYTELIMGLPGETVESWKKGLETLASDMKGGSLYIYNCGVFENAPMNTPAYLDFNKIKSIRSPIYLSHSSIHERGIPEYENIIVSSSSFTTEDLKKIYLYSWIIQVYHNFGIFEFLTKFYKKENKISIMQFYDTFLDFCKTSDTIFSDEYNIIIPYIEDGYAGKGWNHHDPVLGDIYWAIEEASWLRLVLNKSRLIDDTKKFLNFLNEQNNLAIDEKLLEDLINFQIFLLTTKIDSQTKSENFRNNWKNYFVNEEKLENKEIKYSYNNQIIEKDPILWGFKTIWYGRQPGNYKLHPDELEEKIINKVSLSESNKN